MSIKTLRVRIKDKHSRVLSGMAASVNIVWNYLNEYARHEWKAKRVFVGNYGPSGFAAQTVGAAKQLGILAWTIQSVCENIETQKKRNKKAWLKSRGKKSLGWIPFKSDTVRMGDGFFVFMKQRFDVWDSYGLSGFEAKSGNIVQDSRGNWFLCVSTEIERTDVVDRIEPVGVDLGLKDVATVSDGQKLTAKWYHRIQEKLAVAQRANNKKRVRALHAKAKNQRQDALHKFSTVLVRQYGAIYVGDVSTEFLIKFSPKSTMDAGHGMLKSMLRYKSQQAGRVYAEVSEKFTTQTCSECGSIAGPRGRAGLNERAWTCRGCGTSHDRDVNAARNILALGLGHGPLAGGMAEAVMSRASIPIKIFKNTSNLENKIRVN